MKNKIKLRNRAKSLDPVIRIGKNGITDSVINELLRQLKKKRLIKIKFLKSFITNKDKKLVVQELMKKTNSEVIDVIGNVIVLYKAPSIENNLNKKSHSNK